MQKPLLGVKTAVLVANGFNEKDLTETQTALQKLGTHVRIISMDHGLVNSWSGDGWGLNFAADQVLSAALAADYEMLVVPGGQRSADKLKLTAHTKRFIGGFLDAQKPVVLFGEALDLLIFADKIAGRRVAGPQSLKDAAEAAGAEWTAEDSAIDGNLMTGGAADTDLTAYAREAAGFFASWFTVSKAA